MKSILTILSFIPIFLLFSCKQESAPTGQNNKNEGEEIKFRNTYLVEIDSSSWYGELIYVPIYSEVYFGDGGKTIDLTSTLSIHNTDLEHQITVKNINYHNTKGHLIKKFIQESIKLQPLETINFTVHEKDRSGGTGANFIVEWNTQVQVSSPIIEAVMITTQMNQGISFTTNGKIIKKFGTSAAEN
jgi:hypothetical protein